MSPRGSGPQSGPRSKKQCERRRPGQQLLCGRIPTHGYMPDPLPLSPRQVWALLAASSLQLLWGLRGASLELDAWRARAAAIPSAEIRDDALKSLDTKRGHADGAALFWTLPRRRDPALLRLLVRYQVIWDFLDCVNERAAERGTRNGRQLHLALVEALDPGAPI